MWYRKTKIGSSYVAAMDGLQFTPGPKRYPTAKHQVHYLLTSCHTKIVLGLAAAWSGFVRRHRVGAVLMSKNRRTVELIGKVCSDSGANRSDFDGKAKIVKIENLIQDALAISVGVRETERCGEVRTVRSTRLLRPKPWLVEDTNEHVDAVVLFYLRPSIIDTFGKNRNGAKVWIIVDTVAAV